MMNQASTGKSPEATSEMTAEQRLEAEAAQQRQMADLAIRVKAEASLRRGGKKK